MATDAPSTKPTVEPSVMNYNPSICTYGCVILSGSESIIMGKRVAYLTLPRYFKASFEVSQLVLPTTNVFVNMLAIVDIVANRVLLGVYVTDTLKLGIVYNGTVVTLNGPVIHDDYTNVFTTITVEVSTTTVRVSTSAVATVIPVPLPGGAVNSVDHVCALYTSVGGTTSTTGTIRNIAFTRKNSMTITTSLSMVLHSFPPMFDIGELRLYVIFLLQGCRMIQQQRRPPAPLLRQHLMYPPTAWLAVWCCRWLSPSPLESA